MPALGSDSRISPVSLLTNISLGVKYQTPVRAHRASEVQTPGSLTRCDLSGFKTEPMTNSTKTQDETPRLL